MNPSSLASWAVSALLLAATLATLAAAAERLRMTDVVARREALLTSCALFAAAFVARWVAAPHTLIHENHHGYEYVATRGRSLLDVSLFHDVPSAHRVLVALTHALIPARHEPVFVLDAALSALGVPALFWLAARTFGRLAGVAAASLLLLQPLALLMAPTEEPLNLAVAAAPAGMVLIQLGLSRASYKSLVAGCALVGVAATTREITLPLAALAPLAMLSVRRSPRVPWWVIPAACAILGVALAPQLLAIVAARRAHTNSSSLVTWPHLPFPGDPRDIQLRHRIFNPRWVGWAEPYIPFWMGAAMCAAWALLALRCVVRRDLRTACVGLLAPLVAVVQGGLVAHGWFPSGLRHGLFSMALCLLPVAWLYGALARRLPSRAAAWLLAPVACLVAASRGGFSAMSALPMAQEYRFTRGAVAAMRPGDGFVVLSRRDIDHIPAQWVSTVRPDVATIADSQISAGARRLWLVTDRVCAMDRECFRNPTLCSALGNRAARPPQDMSNDACARALQALPWRLVRSARVCAPPQGSYPQPYDLPPRDRCATLGLYLWSAP